MSRQRSFAFLGSLVTLLLAIVPLDAQDGCSTAGDGLARHLAALGRLPAPEDVIVEDIINYHRHEIRSPRAGEAVAFDLRAGNSVAAAGSMMAIQAGFATARLGDRSDLPPLSLALVIDCSGSMDAQDKIGKVKQALARFVDQLRPHDRVAIVAFADEAQVVRDCEEVGDGATLRTAVEALKPDGSTNLNAGLLAGYELLKKIRRKGDSHRVILLTDGIANRGVTDPEEITKSSRQFNELGIDLSTIGLGFEFNRDLLQTLSKSGRGLFHFVASPDDIAKVFVAEFQSLVAPVALRPRLEISWDAGIESVQIYGYEPTIDHAERRVEIALPTMNHGLTQVVMGRIRVRPGVAEGSILKLRGRLSFEHVDSGERVVHETVLDLRVDSADGRLLVDPQVKKNITIAELAQAIHDMAILAQKNELELAAGTVSGSLLATRLRFPSREDKDVERVARMVEEYRHVIVSSFELPLED